MPRRLLLPLLTLGLLLVGLPAAPAADLLLPVTGPAGSPRLSPAPDGSLLLSWMEPLGKRGSALRFARLGEDGTWSTPATVRKGKQWFRTWADAPTVAQTVSGWVALWLVPAGGEGHGDHLVFSLSEDGRKWSKARRVHDDESATEHGFASLLAGPDGVDAAWLDGRAYADGGAETQLLARRLGAELGPERVLDARTCDCCPTAATADGRVLAWRDRLGGEIRDISVGRREQDFATVRATHDEWDFAGCPVNGPALASNDGDLLAWFTADGVPRVQAVLLHEEGWRPAPVLLAEGAGLLGRVGAAPWGEGWLVTWAQEAAEGRAELRARAVDRAGQLGEVLVLGETPAARSAGFPAVAPLGGDVVVVWQDGDPSALRGIRLPGPAGAPTP